MFAILSAQPLRYPVNYFGPKDYHAGFHNYSFVQNKKGMVFIGNEDGVIEFDGQKFRNIPIKKGCNALSLGIDATNEIYIGSKDEIGKLIYNNRGLLEYKSLTENLNASSRKFGSIINIHCVYNTVFFVANNSVILKTANKFTILWSEKTIKSTFTLNNNLFVEYKEGGIGLVTNNEIKNLRISSEWVNENLISVIPYRKNKVILFHKNLGFCITNLTNSVDTGTIECESLFREYSTELLKHEPTGAKQLDNDRIAIFTNLSGVYILDRDLNLISILNKAKGIKFNRVKNIFSDRDHFLWLALENGINRVDFKSEYSYYDEGSGITGSTFVTKRHKGLLLIGTSNGLFIQKAHKNKLEAESDKSIFHEFTNISAAVTSFLCIDSSLFAITVDGLYSIDVKKITATKVLSGEFTHGIKLSGQEKLIALCNKEQMEIYSYDLKAKSHFQLKYEFTGIPADITSICQDSSNADHIVIWVGTKYSGVRKYSILKGIPTPVSEVFSLDEGIPDGRSFVASYGTSIIVGTQKGLKKFNSNKNNFTTCADFGTELNKDNRDITFILALGMKNVWFTSKTNGLTAVGRYSDEHISNKLYEENEYNEINIGQINGIYEDGKTFWFNGNDGLLSYSPSFFTQRSNRISVAIRSVYIHHDSLLFGGYFSIDNNYSDQQSKNQIYSIHHDFNTVEFNYCAVNVHLQEKVKYSYLLEGYSEGWSPWTTDNHKEFTNLPKGTYTFKVRAMNHKGVLSEETSYKFYMEAPWFLKTWAIICYVMIIALIIYSINYYSLRRLKKSRMRLEKTVKERTYEILIKNKELESSRTELEQKNKDIIDSINYAQRIQQSILPELHDFTSDFPESFILFMPRDIVSGDFYWYHKIHKTINGLDEEYLIVAAADCTGHGVSGALMSVMGASILNEVVSVAQNIEPAEILTQLNIKLRTNLKQEKEDAITRDGMDIALCMINKRTNLMTFAGAFRPCYIVRDFKVIELSENKFPIGGFLVEEDRTYKQEFFQLEKNDCIYILSDGYPSQFGGPKSKKYTTKRFRDTLTGISHLPMNEQKVELILELEDWQGEQEQIDDILVIGIKV